MAEILITQDIHRGEVVIVFDPKGDAALMKQVVAEAHRAGRQNSLTLFHLGYPEISARYNPVGNFSRITEVATRIANQLPSQGNSAAFREFAWRFTNIIGRALVALGRRPDYGQIIRYVKDNNLYDGVADGLCSAFEYDKKYFDKLVASLLPLMEKLVSVNLHADEFNELIGDEFVPLVNKAGGAGFQVTAYTQTWSDVFFIAIYPVGFCQKLLAFVR
jgi:hypothetical protein